MARAITAQVMRTSSTVKLMVTKFRDFCPDRVDFSTISIWLSDFPIIVTLWEKRTK